MASRAYFGAILILFLHNSCFITSKNLASRLGLLEVRLNAEETVRRAEAKLFRAEIKNIQDVLINNTLQDVEECKPADLEKEATETEPKGNFTLLMRIAFADEKLLNTRVRKDVTNLKTNMNGLLRDHQNVITNISSELMSLRGDIKEANGKKSCNYKIHQLEVNIEVLSDKVNTILDVMKTENSKHQSCQDLLLKGQNISGVYEIYPNGRATPVLVYCDQETDGGGWTVIQRREDGTVDFYRGWLDYKFGFGNVEGEFWLGNEYIHEITRLRPLELRIDMEDFENTKKYAKYREFQIGSKFEKYSLNVGGYSGDAEDSLSGHSAHQFSTKDRDNDVYHASCSQQFKGGWWYTKCHSSNLNGLYHFGKHNSFADGINWFKWRGYNYSLKFVEMKMR